MAYNPAADALLQDTIGALHAIGAERQATAELIRTQGLVDQLQEVKEWNAGNLAEKHALRLALQKVDPNHPLLTNMDLQNRIKDAGRRALSMTKDWDAPRRAGETFKY